MRIFHGTFGLERHLSPIDGRYGNKTQKLRCLFSEFGLIKFRFQIDRMAEAIKRLP